jgi:hypothetical protein
MYLARNDFSIWPSILHGGSVGSSTTTMQMVNWYVLVQNKCLRRYRYRYLNSQVHETSACGIRGRSPACPVWITQTGEVKKATSVCPDAYDSYTYLTENKSTGPQPMHQCARHLRPLRLTFGLAATSCCHLQVQLRSSHSFGPPDIRNPRLASCWKRTLCFGFRAEMENSKEGRHKCSQASNPGRAGKPVQWSLIKLIVNKSLVMLWTRSERTICEPRKNDEAIPRTETWTNNLTCVDILALN